MQFEAFYQLLTTDWRQARADLPALEQSLLQLGGYASREAFLKNIAPQTTVITIVGGAATRWDKSFDDPEGQRLAESFGIKRGQSRFLAKVPNLLPQTISTEKNIPILYYNLYGVRPLLVGDEGQQLGRHVLIYGKDEDRAELEQITQELGITNSQLLKQAIHPGRHKPSGHADALLQHHTAFAGSTYVVAHFGGDATSFTTVLLSLLALDVVKKHNLDITLILPVAPMAEPKYPVFIDADGLPRQFGHAKLLGEASLNETNQQLSMGGSNVGVRAYDTAQLVAALTSVGQRYQDQEEFALDHLDQDLADRGQVRQFAIAQPEEITHAAKTLTELPAFLENLKVVLPKVIGSNN